MDKKEALKLVQEHGDNLERLENEFKKDKEIVLIVLNCHLQNGKLLP